MAVNYRNAIGMRAHRDGGRLYRGTSQVAEDLAGFRLDLFLFAADKRDHVAQQVERGNAGVPRSRRCLHGRDEELFKPERDMEWCQRHHEPRRRAVRVRDDATLPSPLLLLALEQRQMTRVYLGHQERHIRRHAVNAGIGDDEGTALGECLLQWSRDIGVERREHDATGQWRLAPLYHQPGDRLRYWSALPPADNFAVGLSSALFRRC